MKKSYKLILINVGLGILVSVMFAIMMGEPMMFLIALGTVSALLGFLNLVVGLIFIPLKRQEWMQAFLICGGVLFLLGVGICGPMLLFSI